MRESQALAVFHDLAPDEESFRDAVLAGLGSRQKSIPCRFLYDARGSALFEAICELPEYYPTRTETAILEENAAEIAALIGLGSQLVEFGSGASRKVRTLLRALEAPAAYVAIDISREQLRSAADALAADFPDLPIVAVCADYMRPLDLAPLPQALGRRLGFFPGSTIGNFTPLEAIDFLRGSRHVVGSDGAMLIGVDLQSRIRRRCMPPTMMCKASLPPSISISWCGSIASSAPISISTASRMKRSTTKKRVGSKSTSAASADQIVTVAGRAIRFTTGERIHTEDSCKYTIEGFRRLAARAGFRPVRTWTDRNLLFSIHFLAPM